MKKIIFLFSILFVVSCNAQNLDNFYAQDTIYIYFDHTKNQKKQVFTNVQDIITGEYYYFYFANRYDFLLFVYNNISGKTSEVSEAFLKKHRSNTITEAQLKKYTLIDLDKILKRKRKIYLIDTQLALKNKIVLKEVDVTSSVIYEE